jgi:ribosomal protein S4
MRTDEEIDEQLRLYAAEREQNIERNDVWWWRVDKLLDERLEFMAYDLKLARSIAVECARQRLKRIR